MTLTAEGIIKILALVPYPEGGYYRETWHKKVAPGERVTCGATYYLLRSGNHRHRHRVDAAEICHYYAGDDLKLLLRREKGDIEKIQLGVIWRGASDRKRWFPKALGKAQSARVHGL